MLLMYNLLNFLNIDSGDYIHEKNVGLNTSTKEQYALLGFHLIDDIEEIENKGKLTFITFINSIEKMNSLLTNKIDLDYLEILYREKFMVGKSNEYIYKSN